VAGGLLAIRKGKKKNTPSPVFSVEKGKRRKEGRLPRAHSSSVVSRVRKKEEKGDSERVVLTPG